MGPVKKLEELINILIKKKSLLSEMNSLTKSQSVCIAEADTDRLTKLISSKDQVIKQIADIDDDFNRYYYELKTELKVESLELSDVLPRNLLLELKSKTKEIMDIIQETIEIDNSNMVKAQELKDSFAKEMKKINGSKQMSKAYFGKSEYFQGSYFIDSKK